MLWKYLTVEKHRGGGGWGRGTSYVSYLINFWSIYKISIILSTPSAPGAFLWDDRSSWYNFDWLQSPLQTHMYYDYIRKTVRNERLFFFNNESTMKRLFVSIAVVFKKQDGCVYCRHVHCSILFEDSSPNYNVSWQARKRTKSQHMENI